MQILGIDPGLTGAMCLLNQYGDILASLIFEPKDKQFDDDRFLATLKDIKFEHPEMVVFLEKVHAMPGQGVSSMFKFGRTLGFIQGVILTHDLPLNMVTPQTWMKELHSDRDMDLSPKLRSRRAAERLYPGIDLRKSKRATVPHEGFVDALLIAEYGRRLICEARPN